MQNKTNSIKKSRRGMIPRPKTTNIYRNIISRAFNALVPTVHRGNA